MPVKTIWESDQVIRGCCTPSLTVSKNKTGGEGVNTQSVLQTCMHPPGRAAECGKETERRRRLAYSFIADSDKQWQKVQMMSFQILILVMHHFNIYALCSVIVQAVQDN